MSDTVYLTTRQALVYMSEDFNMPVVPAPADGATEYTFVLVNKTATPFNAITDPGSCSQSFEGGAATAAILPDTVRIFHYDDHIWYDITP